MKKVICVLLAVLTCAVIVGCGASQDERPVRVNQGKTVEDVMNDKTNESAPATEDATVQSEEETPAETKPTEEGSVEVDLTALSATMVYSEVYHMTSSPEEYMGKCVKMKGSLAYSKGKDRYYCACLIKDATACCAQGIEFVLKDGRKFPDEYPPQGTAITVVGIFDTYTEGTRQYCQLIDATMDY